MGTSRKGRNSLRFGAESGGEAGPVRWREHSIENLPPAAVLPLDAIEELAAANERYLVLVI